MPGDDDVVDAGDGARLPAGNVEDFDDELLTFLRLKDELRYDMNEPDVVDDDEVADAAEVVGSNRLEFDIRHNKTTKS